MLFRSQLLPVPFRAQKVTHLPLDPPEIPLDSSPSLQCCQVASQRVVGTARRGSPRQYHDAVRTYPQPRFSHRPAVPCCYTDDAVVVVSLLQPGHITRHLAKPIMVASFSHSYKRSPLAATRAPHTSL